MLDLYTVNKKAFQSNANFPLSNSPCFIVDMFRAGALHMGSGPGSFPKGTGAGTLFREGKAGALYGLMVRGPKVRVSFEWN